MVRRLLFFWAVTPCASVERWRRCEGAYCFRFEGALESEAADFSETCRKKSIIVLSAAINTNLTFLAVCQKSITTLKRARVSWIVFFDDGEQGKNSLF